MDAARMSAIKELDDEGNTLSLYEVDDQSKIK